MNAHRGRGTVYTGDARHLHWILPPELHGQAALVVTSPPYGPSTHGRVTADHIGCTNATTSTSV